MKIDGKRVNEAMWAACNMRYGYDEFGRDSGGGIPSMEDASQAAMRAIAAYEGVEYEEVKEAWEEWDADNSN